MEAIVRLILPVLILVLVVMASGRGNKIAAQVGSSDARCPRTTRPPDRPPIPGPEGIRPGYMPTVKPPEGIRPGYIPTVKPGLGTYGSRSPHCNAPPCYG